MMGLQTQGFRASGASDMTKKRDYKKEYAEFHSTRKAKNARNNANKARRKKKLRPGDPREVDHKKPQGKGGTNAKSNLRIVSKPTNRRKGANYARRKKS